MAKKQVVPGWLQSKLLRLFAFVVALEGLHLFIQNSLPFCFQKFAFNSTSVLQIALGLIMLLAGLFVLKGWAWGLPILAIPLGYQLYIVGSAFWAVRGEINDLTGSIILLGVMALLLGATLLCILSWHLGRLAWKPAGRLWWWLFYLCATLLTLGTAVQFDEQGPHPAIELSAKQTRDILKPLAKSGASLALLNLHNNKLGTLQWEPSDAVHGQVKTDSQGFRIDEFSGIPDFTIRYDACRGLLSIQGQDFYPRSFASDNWLFTQGPSQGIVFERGSGAAHGQVILARELKSDRWHLVLSEFFWYGMEFKALGYRIEWSETTVRKKKKKQAEKSWTACEKAHFKTRNKK